MSEFVETKEGSMENKIKVSIFGATGYAGMELYHYMRNLNHIEIIHLVSKRYKGMDYEAVAGEFYGKGAMRLSEASDEAVVKSSQVIFTAMPHGETMRLAVLAKKYNKKLIDLGADFRIEDVALYEKWYQIPHEAQDLLKEAVYVIPELHRHKINKDTWLVANPGCYPTSVQLGLAPFLKADLVHQEGIIVDAKSGVSGAGRGLSLKTHYCEQNENVAAYSVGGHRHKPEIESQLGQWSKDPVKILFTPHLMPMFRGIHSTIYGRLKSKVSEEDLRQILEEAYKDETFVTLLPKGVMPHTKWVSGTNHCQLNVVLDEETGMVVILSAIDNLGKGAAGQALQNMNILCGLDESLGLL